MTVHIDDFDGLPRSLESVRVVDVLAPTSTRRRRRP